MNYLRRRCTWNIQISPLTKITKLMPASYLQAICFHLSQHVEISSDVILISLWTTQTNLGGMFKIIQDYAHYDGANKMQIEQHWGIPQTVPYSVQINLKQQVLRTNNENLKNGKVRFRLNIDVRKEIEDSRLNAIECRKTDYVCKRSTEF